MKLPEIIIKHHKKIIMRVFVAVEITSDKIINSISKFQSEINIDAKPVELHNLHFTLQFLGEISQDTRENNNCIKFCHIF